MKIGGGENSRRFNAAVNFRENGGGFKSIIQRKPSERELCLLNALLKALQTLPGKGVLPGAGEDKSPVAPPDQRLRRQTAHGHVIGHHLRTNRCPLLIGDGDNPGAGLHHFFEKRIVGAKADQRIEREFFFFALRQIPLMGNQMQLKSANPGSGWWRPPPNLCPFAR